VPGANYGDKGAIFETRHGTAPDIAGESLRAKAKVSASPLSNAAVISPFPARPPRSSVKYARAKAASQPPFSIWRRPAAIQGNPAHRPTERAAIGLRRPSRDVGRGYRDRFENRALSAMFAPARRPASDQTAQRSDTISP